MKLSFCPQKILLIRPLAKSFPVMGVWCRCTLHGGGGEYGGGAWIKVLEHLRQMLLPIFCVHQVHVYKPTSFTSSMSTLNWCYHGTHVKCKLYVNDMY